MKTIRSFITLFIVAYCVLASVALAGPTVSNVTFTQRAGTRLVDITYDLAVTGANPTVALAVSSDAGATFAVPVVTVSGAVGAGVAAGTGKTITWDAGTDWPGQLSSSVRVRVAAWDLVGPGSAEFALIPGGTYQRGDNLDGLSDAPVQSIGVGGFYMGKTELSKAQWDVVKTWGATNGYTDLPVGAGKAADHPVQTVSWYAVVKWCNAASEMEGLTPVYYTNDAQTTVYRTGNVNVTPVQVKWGANGYRLPTEAEWEKAARGGVTGQRFPWGNTISKTLANYYGDTGSYPYDSGPNGYHATYATGATPYTNPVGDFTANAYGLKNMSGNVFEWCWDWYGTYVASSDPKGPATGSNRVLRGGSWGNNANYARCAQRISLTPDLAGDFIGVRVARVRP